jgi:hypothetical protein
MTPILQPVKAVVLTLSLREINVYAMMVYGGVTVKLPQF